jgi:toxin ParE1/3/4
MFSYFLTIEAEDDIIRIFEYGLGQFGPNQAKKYYDNLFDTFKVIASNLYMFPVVDNYKNVVRFCLCGVDTIYFNIIGNEIEIVTIIGRQNF